MTTGAVSMSTLFQRYSVQLRCKDGGVESSYIISINQCPPPRPDSFGPVQNKSAIPDSGERSDIIPPITGQYE